MSEDGVVDKVKLVIPARANLVLLARLTAATIGSRADFDVEEIEDLRLAVDELCVSVIEGGRDGRLELEFVRDGDRVEVSCEFHRDAAGRSLDVAHESLDGLSDRILDALVDDHGADGQGGRQRAWLRKRRARQQA